LGVLFRMSNKRSNKARRREMFWENKKNKNIIIL